MTDEEYIAHQLDRVCEREDGGYLLKVVGERSETKYLLITADQLDKIQAVLTAERPHPRAGVEYLSSAQAAAYLHVSTTTLGKYVSTGWLRVTFRTPGGHNRFTVAELDRYKQDAAERARHAN